MQVQACDRKACLSQPLKVLLKGDGEVASCGDVLNVLFECLPFVGAT